MVIHVDINQKEIVNRFKRKGAKVSSTTMVGEGFPDLDVYYRGFHLLVEIKNGDAKLRDNQKIWHDKRPGMTYVVRTTLDVSKVIGEIDEFYKIIEESGIDCQLIERLKRSEDDHRSRRAKRSRQNHRRKLDPGNHDENNVIECGNSEVQKGTEPSS